MASCSACMVSVFALLVVFQFVNADDLGDILSPLLSPIFENVCKQVECGKGTCKPSDNIIPFECDCDSGWKKVFSDDDDDDHDHDNVKFLPCIIPNCTLNYSCSKAPPPGQQNKPRVNGSIFDPCRWADCGGGSCNKTSPFTHECVCSEGYYNLLNITAFPCFKDCTIGMDCQRLGIPLTNASSSANPSSSVNEKSYATRLVLERGTLSIVNSTCAVFLFLLLLLA